MANQAQNTNPATITSVGTATSGGTANSAKPAIVGTAQPYSTVEIFDGGRLIGIAGVDINGNWTFVPPSNMSSGVHQFTALAIDTMGVFGPMSTPFPVSIPTAGPVVPPPPPVIESVVDAVGPVQGNVPSGGTTDDNHPTISGTGIPGNTIYVYQNGLGCANTIVDSTGHWSVKITGALSEGLHNMTATQFPSGGAASAASSTWAITVDTSTPAKPAVPSLTDDNGVTIPAGSTTNDNHPHINGTGKAGDIIIVFDSGTVIGSTTIGSNGKWTFMPAGLRDTLHAFQVAEMTPAGKMSEFSGAISVWVNSSVPATPVIYLTDDNGATIPANSTTNDNHPHINGTGTAGTIIMVLDSGKLIGSITVGATGQWTFATSNLNDGLHGLQAYAVSTAGTMSGVSNGVVVTVSTSVPAVPATPTLTDDNGATIPAGSTTNDNHPHINGTGTAGDIIKVYDGSTVLGSTTVGPNGKWTFTPGNLPAGAHSINVTETNAAGTSSAHSGSIGFIYSNVAPSPVITSVVDAVGPVQGNVPSGGTTDDTQPTISGTGIPGDTVYVFLANSSNYGGQPYGAGDTVVDAGGHWSVRLNKGMPSGLNTITATQFAPGAAQSVASAAWVVTVDTSTPAQPATPTLTDDSGANIPAGSTAANNHPHINGTGKAGDVITVYDGSTVLGSATVGSNGQWSFATGNLPTGSHSFNVTETNAAGTSSAHSGSIGFTYGTTALPPVITNMVDTVGPVQGTIPNNGVTDDSHPTVSGTGTAGSLVRIYQNGSGCGTTIVDATGHWTVKVSDTLSDGMHAMVATQAGNGQIQSTISNTWTIWIDTSTPAQPATPTLTDDSGANIPAGSTAANNHPHINGTGKAGDVITVYDGSTVLGSTTIGSNGQWSFATGNLPTGSHSFNVTETNAAGTSSAHSGSIGFTYGTTTLPPVITNMVDAVGPVQGTIPNNGVTDDSHPTVSGTGTAGSVVRIYQNGSGCGTTIVDATGHWTVKVSDTLSDGMHAIVATQIANGQSLSPISNTWTIWIDTSTPAQPATPTLTDDSGANIPAGSTTSDGHPNISGTGVAGNLIRVYDGSTVIGSTTVGADGKWTFKPSSDLSQGSHSISVTAVNAAGTTSSASGAVGITVGLGMSTPTITNVWDTKTGVTISVGNKATSGLTGLAGRGTPGAEIHLYGQTAYAGKIAIVDANGYWSTGAAYASAIATGGNSTFPFSVTQVVNGTESAHSNVWLIRGVDASYSATFDPTVHADDHSQAASVGDTDQSAPQTNHHTVVGEHDAFVGKLANGNETVDLNTDPASYFKESTAHIQGAGGGAVDTLHLTGDHQVLDLTSLTGKTAAAKISGIEVVDLGGQHNTLKLSLTDVLNLGETDLFQKDGKQQMMVQGKEGDTVDLSNTHIAGLADGEWAAHGTAVVGGVTYNVYEHSGAHTELLVQQGVQIIVH